MKVISVMEPYASLIALELKRFETRSWATKYRGPIAVHASKKNPKLTLRSLSSDVQKSIFDCIYEKLEIQSGAIDKMNPGCIIATANLTECYEIYEDHSGSAVLMIGDAPKVWVGKDSNEFVFGDYSHGRFAWELQDVKRIEPIPAKGQLGLWNYNMEVDES